MALVIGTNMSSLAAQRSLQQSEQLMSKSMERLSSGSKINTAADDAAGLALSNRMDNQATSLHVAIKNMNDGIALTEAIEGSLNEVDYFIRFIVVFLSIIIFYFTRKNLVYPTLFSGIILSLFNIYI